jgi:hypothetical protein
VFQWEREWYNKNIKKTWRVVKRMRAVGMCNSVNMHTQISARKAYVCGKETRRLYKVRVRSRAGWQRSGDSVARGGNLANFRSWGLLRG